MARNDFPTGLVLDAHKRQATDGVIVELAAPAQVLLALDQGSGSVLEPVVAVGEFVAVGTTIARPVDPYGAVLHSPVSGRVTAIAVRDAASETGSCRCVEIENDGKDARDPATGRDDPLSLEPPDLVDRLYDAGIAGLGGAAFPTATKLQAARERTARRLLLNGAECEPWICCDDALMRAEAGDVVLGARVLMHALEATSCVVVVEDDKPAAIEALRQAISIAHVDDVVVETVPAVYPQGAERQLITAMTGVEVPSRGLPADVGVTLPGTHRRTRKPLAAPSMA